MNKKYKVKCYFKGELESKYSVKLNDIHTTVKDQSEELYPEFRGKNVLKVEDTKWGIAFKVGEQSMEMDYCQEQYLLAALLVRAKDQGIDIEVIQKG